MADPGGDRVLIVETWLAGRPRRPRPTERRPCRHEHGTDGKHWNEVARRFRRVRLWSSLALCWLAWALVGGLLAVAGVAARSVVDGRVRWPLAMLAAATGLRRSFAMRSARDPRWVARRIEASIPNWTPACWPPSRRTPRLPRAGSASCKPP